MEVLTWLQFARVTAAAAVPSYLAGRLFAALRWACKHGKAAIQVARRFAMGRPGTRLRVERLQQDGIAVVRIDWSYGGDDLGAVEGALSLLTALASSEAVTSSGRRRQKHRRKGPRRAA
jgi:hypothetical protein